MEIDTLLEALKDFEKKGKEVSPLLEQFLCHVAKTGETLVSWSQFKSYFIFKLEKVMDDFRESAPEQRGPPNPNVECIPFDEMKARIMKIVNGYTGIPFTIQRLCELLIEPKRNYTGTEKFLRGVEKNVMVVSCVHPTSEKNGCSGVKVNGVLLPGNSSAFAERKVNGPGTPRPLNRQKVLLSSSLATNGLPDSTENKDPNTAGAHGKSHSESSVSGPSRLARNKHSVKDEDEGLEEEEQPEVKRLKFLKDGEDGAEDDDEEEEDEEEDDADETAAVETLRPTLAESSSDAQQARAHSSASPDKQRDEELEDEEEEEDSVPASSTADCQDQEPSSTQTELCAEESKAGEKEAEREAKAEREVPSSAADDSNAEEPADMDQSEQRAPSGVAGSPESREAGEESNEHVSSSSSSSSSSCSEENEESAATSATPSDSTTEPPAEGTLESGAQDSAAADEPMEVD